jgi:hypothetical protein
MCNNLNFYAAGSMNEYHKEPREVYKVAIVSISQDTRLSIIRVSQALS